MTKSCLVLSSLVSLMLVACGDTSSSQPPTPASSQSEASAEASQPATEFIKITSAALGKAYEENEAAADDQYKDKNLELSGTIQSIQKDAFDNTVVSLNGVNEFSNVMATLSDVASKDALKLKKKQKVTLVCIGNGEVMGSPMLKDCSVKSASNAEKKSGKK